MSELKHQLMMNKEHSWVFAYIKSEADKVFAELKYKRCLAMYRYCSIKALYELDFKGNDVEWKWYSKWMHKWFKLAKKFKGVK